MSSDRLPEDEPTQPDEAISANDDISAHEEVAGDDISAVADEGDAKSHVSAVTDEGDAKSQVSAVADEGEAKSHISGFSDDGDAKSHISAVSVEGDSKSHISGVSDEGEAKSHISGVDDDGEAKSHISGVDDDGEAKSHISEIDGDGDPKSVFSKEEDAISGLVHMSIGTISRLSDDASVMDVSLSERSSPSLAPNLALHSESTLSLPDGITLPEEEIARGSMITQAGSYSLSLGSGDFKEESTDQIFQVNFQEYVERYADLFGKKGKEEVSCGDDEDKAFLKIDVNELISGYKSEYKTSKDAEISLSGMTRVRQDIICIENEPIVLKKDYKYYGGVRTLSGGHMGKEPLYIDYVGKGMLTGVVLGTAIDPPTVAAVTKAMRELIVGSSGLLVIIQNNVEYRLIFGLAMERIRMEGYEDVDMVAVGDDCFERCKSPVGRRGLAGIVLLYKLAGSMADCKKSLRDIYIAVRLAASTGLATISCITEPLIAIGTGLDKNSKDGIHFKGDRFQMIKRMVDYCLHPLRYFSLRLNGQDSVVVLVNWYRNKSPEFYAVVDLIVDELEKRSVTIERVYADNFVTGFWPGFSISLMIDCNSHRMKFLDSPTSVPLWPRNPSNGSRSVVNIQSDQKKTWTLEMGPILLSSEVKVVRNAVLMACKAMVMCEHVLNAMHFFGNYGSRIKMGAEAILQAHSQSQLHYERPFNLLIKISEILVEKLPGVTGAMYGILFEGAARSFLRSPLSNITIQNWSEAMDEALKTLRAYTNAKGGIVSLALSLIPVVTALHGPYINLPQRSSSTSNKNPVLDALESLKREIEARANKTVDVKGAMLKNQLDVESYALIIWLHAIYSSIYWKQISDSSPKEDDETEVSSTKKVSLECNRKSLPGRHSKSASIRSQVSRVSKKPSLELPTLSGINESLHFLEQSEESVKKMSASSGDKQSSKSVSRVSSEHPSIKEPSRKSNASGTLTSQSSEGKFYT